MRGVFFAFCHVSFLFIAALQRRIISGKQCDYFIAIFVRTIRKSGKKPIKTV